MKKILILIFAAAILLSGCVGTEKTVKKGDNISINYIGSYENGKVFDTSIEKVARANDLYTEGEKFEPLKLTVGKTPRAVIQGLDEGVIGMKVGETKKLVIPPEKAYPINPSQIQVIPIVQDFPALNVISKVFEVPLGQFEQFIGPNHSVGDSVTIPETNLNVTVTNMTTSEVSLKYDNLTIGSRIWYANAPWNETVIKIDDKNITTKPVTKKNDIIQFQGVPFNSTVIGFDEKNITLRHNYIPETIVPMPGMFGQMVDTKFTFNETSVIIDRNSKVAGKTLLFNVTLVSIDK